MRALISGAGIAGPALALCLSRYGWDVTVVERSDELRSGGQAVDFKGATHRLVLERMGILQEVQRYQTGKTDTQIVNERDRVLATMPGEFSGGDIEILRGDLARVMYEASRDRCTYVFGDSITGMIRDQDGIDVIFQKRENERFDLVFGADGVHSVVRRLAFGPDERFVRFLGYYYAVTGRSAGRGAGDSVGRATSVMFNVPGRKVTVGGSKAPTMFVFASDQLSYDRSDADQQRRIVADAYAGIGWRVPALLEEMYDEPEFYLDAFNRVLMTSYTRGRVALLGDAAYANTLGGFGTGLALVGAYVLAGELAAAGGDHVAAFRRYDQLMYRYAKIARTGNAGPFLAPPSRLRIRLRNWTFANPLLMRIMMKMADGFATDIRLPDYPSAAFV